MSNIIKSIKFILVVGVVAWATSSFAQVLPEFETLSPVVFQNEVVQLRGNYRFDSRDYSARPETNFEFGTNPSDLEFSTPIIKQFNRSKEISQGVTLLQANTQYYVRAVVRFDGDTFYGETKSFNPSILTPVTGTVSQSQISSVGTTSVTNTAATTASGNQTIVRPLSPLAPTRISNSTDTSFGFKRIFGLDKNDKELEEKERMLELREKALLAYEDNLRQPREGIARSDFDNSATNDFDNGDIVVAARTNNNDIRSRALTASVGSTSFAQNSGTTSPTLVALFIMMLVIIALLVRITSKKRKRAAYAYAHPNQAQYQVPGQSKYTFNNSPSNPAHYSNKVMA